MRHLTSSIAKSALLFLAIPLFFSASAFADAKAVYQYGVTIDKPADQPLIWTKTTAFLWVPPASRHLRAVLLAPANIIERRVADDPSIRAMAARNDMAIVFFQAGWKQESGNTALMAETMEHVLDALAAKSGYSELRIVPWVVIGHSGNSKFCASLARFRPERVAAVVVIKGGLPTPQKDAATGAMTNAGITGIPILFITGEFEEVMPPEKVRNGWWATSMTRFATVREAVPDALIAGLEDKSHGHVCWFPPANDFVTLYIEKALHARLSKDGSDKLRPVSFESGWLGDPDLKLPEAPVSKYTGAKSAAFWFFDEEEATAWHALMAHDLGKKEQMLAFTQNGQIAPWWNGWALQSIQFQPDEDGVTFHASAVWRDAVPAPFADAGKPLGHASDGAIQYLVFGWAGNIEQVGPDAFRFAEDREGVNGRTMHVLLGAYHPGNAEYRETMSAASFDMKPNTGRAQSIDFPPLKDVSSGTKEIVLRATSSSRLPVRYYISWGPAVVEDGVIHLKDTPARAKQPIEVSVTAYQWGRAGKDPVATANSVTRTFRVLP
jgi:pimeloyl-ACP methyl ester carboxylesterase